MSTFGNTADIYAVVHLVPHTCQHITVDGHTCYYCLLAANQGNYKRKHFLKRTRKVSLSIGIRISMIRCVVNLLLIFKIVHGLMNNPV
jgi:2-phosphoglycerate kinase